MACSTKGTAKAGHAVAALAITALHVERRNSCSSCKHIISKKY